MTGGTSSKREWARRVILGARQYGIGSVLFRHVIGKKLGLNVTDMECLGVLFHRGLTTPSELARHTGLSSGATTAMLDRLERAGLVERRPNPEDRRGSLIAILESGTRKVGPWFDSARKAQDRVVSSYTVEELRTLAGFFEKSAAMWEEERKKVLED